MGAAGSPFVREGLLFVGKTLLFLVGAVFVIAALVELSVAGPSARGILSLAFGLLLAGPPLGFAVRDALRHARRRAPREER